MTDFQKPASTEAQPRRSFLKGVASLPLLGALPAWLGGSRAMAEDVVDDFATYFVKGTYFEACNCDYVCPCIFLNDPTEGYCKAFLGWHIDKGRIGDVVLDGFNMSAWLHAPGNLADGNWSMALYVDERADEAQTKALTEIWAGKHGGHPAVFASLTTEILGVRSTAIEYKLNGKNKHLKVAGAGEVEINAIEGANGKDVTIHDMPLAVAPPYPVVAHESKRVRYNDHGADQLNSGTNGFASPFVYKA